jgi:hypothetical protein
MPTTTAYPHIGDVGLELVVEVVAWDADAQEYAPVDISAATIKKIYLTDPSGTTTAKDAEFDTDGTDGLLKYTTQSGDLSRAGRWKIQGFVEGVSGFSGSTLECAFQVNASRHG